MAVNLGNVKQTAENNFTGTLTLLDGNRPIEFRPLKDAVSENAPDMQIFLKGGVVPIGSARHKIGKTTDEPYVACMINHPQIVDKTLWANLGAANDIDEDDVFYLLAS